MAKELERVQAAGVAVNVTTTLIAAAQSMVVLRLLSPEEFGLIGVVSAIGTLAGVAQHFGVGLGTLQRLAGAEGAASPGILVAGLVTRLALSVPIAAALFLSAPWLAPGFSRDERVVSGLQIFSGILILQGMAEVLIFALGGLFRFRRFYAVKLAFSLVSAVLIASGCWTSGVSGYFLGSLAAWGFGLILSWIALHRVLPAPLHWPSRECRRALFADLFRVGLYAQVAKMCQTGFLQVPVLVMGWFGTDAQTGLLKFALSAAGHLYVVTNAAVSANIAYMSRWLAEGAGTAGANFVSNFERVLWAFSALFLILMALPEEIAFVLGGATYAQAAGLLSLGLCVVYVNAQMLVVSYGVSFAANDLPGYAGSFVILMAVTLTGVSVVTGEVGTPESALLATLGSAALGTLVAAGRSSLKTGISPYTLKAAVLLAVTGGSAAGLLTWHPGLEVRIGLAAAILAGFAVLGRVLGVIDVVGVMGSRLSKRRTTAVESPAATGDATPSPPPPAASGDNPVSESLPG
ncbi:MAG: oligosaccharide flippase family protein [Planctomycetes bacterium]|nr:oligosaccharide flippase family protein [Planctomycetota bacterium]